MEHNAQMVRPVWGLQYMLSRLAEKHPFLPRLTPDAPDKPTSPVMHQPSGTAISTLLESMALMTAKSSAGSFTRNPPVMLRNTSLAASLKPTRFSSTAKSIFIRLPSKPVTERCGVPYAAVLTKA